MKTGTSLAIHGLFLFTFKNLMNILETTIPSPRSRTLAISYIYLCTPLLSCLDGSLSEITPRLNCLFLLPLPLWFYT